MYASNYVNPTTLAADRSIQSPGLITGVFDFDKFINSSTQEHGYFFEEFKKNCSNFTPETAKLRYGASMACANAVTFDSVGSLISRNDSVACDQNFPQSPQRPPQVVCSDVCYAWVNSVITAIENPTAGCNFTQERIAYYSGKFSGTCKNLDSATFNPYYVTPGKCLRGTGYESKMCGFTNLSDAQTHCKQTADACCSSVAGTPAVPIPVATTVVAASPSSNQATSSATSPTAAPTMSSNQGAIPSVALGVIAGVILVIVFVGAGAVFYLIHRKQKRQLAVSNAMSKAKFDGYEDGLGETMASSTTDGSTTNLIFGSSNGQNTISNVYSPQSTVVNSYFQTNENFSVESTPQQQHMPLTASSAHHFISPSIHNSLQLPSTNMTDATFSVFWKVVTPYTPQLEDELFLQYGETVVLETIYNDGWARGTNQNTNKFGYLPITCVEPVEMPPSTLPSTPASQTFHQPPPILTTFPLMDRNNSTATDDSLRKPPDYVSEAVQHPSVCSSTVRLTMTNRSRYGGGGDTPTENGTLINSDLIAVRPSSLYGGVTIGRVGTLVGPHLQQQCRERLSVGYYGEQREYSTGVTTGASGMMMSGSRGSGDGVMMGGNLNGMAASDMTDSVGRVGGDGGGEGRPVVSALGSLARSPENGEMF